MTWIRRTAWATLMVVFLSVGLVPHVEAQTFSAQIQQFWNQLRTGGLVITTLKVGGGGIALPDNSNAFIGALNRVKLFFSSTTGIIVRDYTDSNYLPLSAGGFSNNGNITISRTAPTIASGGCTSPAITWANGTASFLITVGSTCAGVKTITLTLPTSAHFWRVSCDNNTSDAEQQANYLVGRGTSATATVLTNYARTTGLQADFTAADTLLCTAMGG